MATYIKHNIAEHFFVCLYYLTKYPMCDQLKFVSFANVLLSKPVTICRQVIMINIMLSELYRKAKK